jgi:triosephosphate isomerase
VRKPLIAGNWKMNTTVAEAKGLVQTILNKIEGTSSVETVLCPPFISLADVKGLLEGSLVKLGAQNMYFEDKGAYTGEISPLMLVDLCDFVIIGHSERRQYFGETDEIVNKKVKKALEYRLKPILCVGESLKDNEAGKTEQVINNQVKAGLAGIIPAKDLVIAYEPIWAIGTGRAATGKLAGATIGLIRNTVTDIWNNETAESMRLLYGGSVTGDNIAEFIIQADIDGALVGGASLKADDFISIIKQTAKLKSTP